MHVEGPKVFYTSDLHFRHENIIKFCNRPFTNADEMDAALIDKWNKKVALEDDVYIVGDYMYRSRISISDYCKALNGHKHLIVGNHDAPKLRNKANYEAFDSVDGALEITDEGRRVFLSHYPLMTWPARSFLAYEHILLQRKD
jgi:calcineurin-like phosphoesterase family protein